MTEPTTLGKYTKADWDETRLAFSTSLLVDTSLSSLAQNVELPNWPIKGESQTPGTYIDLSWEELMDIPGVGDQPRRIDMLIDILKETMAFDDPFGEMVTAVEDVSNDDTLEKNLKRLDIPNDFPLRLSALSTEALEFCQGEQIETVGSFAQFSQKMAQNIIVGGDFKALLNAIVNCDELSIAQYLPFRPHHKGLHLAEAIGILVAQLSENERLSLLQHYGKKLPQDEARKARLNKSQLHALESILQERMIEIIKYFDADYRKLPEVLNSGTTLERYFIVLNNEQREFICARVLSTCMSKNSDGGSPQKRGGFFSRLFGR